MTPTTPLAQWLARQYGRDKRYKTARNLSLRAGLNPNAVGTVVDRGTADPPTLRKLARELGQPVTKLYLLAGWLTEEEIGLAPDFSGEERDLIDRYRRLPETHRQALTQVVDAMLLPTSE